MPGPPTSAISDQTAQSHATNAAAYASLVIGYVMGVLLASHLTLGNFLAFSLVQVLYCAALWLLLRGFCTARRRRKPDT